MSVNRVSTEGQLSVKDFGCCMLYNPRAVLRHLPINEVFPAVVGNMVSVDVATSRNQRQPSVNRASQFSLFYFYTPVAIQPHLHIIQVLRNIMCNMGRVTVATPKMSVNGASMISGVA